MRNLALSILASGILARSTEIGPVPYPSLGRGSGLPLVQVLSTNIGISGRRRSAWTCDSGTSGTRPSRPRQESVNSQQKTSRAVGGTIIYICAVKPYAAVLNNASKDEVDHAEAGGSIWRSALFEADDHSLALPL